MILLNGKVVLFGHFPNCETFLDIRELDVHKINIVKWIYQDDSDFFKLSLVKEHLNKMNAAAELYIPYLPHSRMDRPNGCYAVSLEVSAAFIEMLSFSKVTIREPHSPASLEFISNVVSEDWCIPSIPTVMKLGCYDSVFFPDYGASERYNVNGIPFAVGKKVRDFASGAIESLEIRGDVAENVLIVDDICSQGGTFIRGANLLKARGAKRVGLLVSYCEPTVFTGHLFKHIDMLYTSEDSLVFSARHPQIVRLV